MWLTLLLLLCFGVLGQEVPRLQQECNFYSFGHWVHCCCHLLSPCRSCCDKTEDELRSSCPPGSWVSNVQATHVGTENGEAVYSLGGVSTSIRQVHDCKHLDLEWSQFQQRLKDIQSDAWALDKTLVDLALQLVSKFNLSSHPLGLEKRAAQVMSQQIYFHENFLRGLPLPRLDEMFCVYGYVSASFVLAVWTQSRTILKDAIWLFRQRWLDMSTSTSWPIGYWDLALNLESLQVHSIHTSNMRQARRVSPPISVESFLGGGNLVPKTASLGYLGHHWKSIMARTHRSNLDRTIRVAFYLFHPGHDLEIPSFLLKTFPSRVELLMIWEGSSSYHNDEKNMQDHVCSGSPQLCISPHRQLPADKSAPWHPAELLICNWYTHCEFLESWSNSKLPLIGYYGGHPLHDIGIRSGKQAVTEMLRPLHRYIKRGDVLLFTEAPYVAETIHAYTGIHLPFYRGLSCYLGGTTYAPAQGRGLLLLKSSSSAGLTKSGWSLKILQMFAGPGTEFDGLFQQQDGFLSFNDMATFRAAVYFPAPHHYLLAQFRELYNMNMPLLVPDRHDFLLHANVWHDRLMNDLQHVPSELWKPPPEDYWKLRHPFSPWLPPPDPPSSEYAQASLYWVQWSEFFQWPHIQHFHGFPHLLQLAHSSSFGSISWRMAEFNRIDFERATLFWQATLPALLSESP
ncbi:unnamed protein product [Polarella glacialis]|uniref:Protein xylosyltransferase n=1 Tax=Polarella glacialis TaxID=89957 RepID=A0A813KL93_POLGL|nr:unnamed protein product [Polarella glacialis]